MARLGLDGIGLREAGTLIDTSDDAGGGLDAERIAWLIDNVIR